MIDSTDTEVYGDKYRITHKGVRPITEHECYILARFKIDYGRDYKKPIRDKWTWKILGATLETLLNAQPNNWIDSVRISRIK